MALAAAIILPQTVLAGHDLSLDEWRSDSLPTKRNGATFGGLYFTNSIGAAVGALAAVFFLLPNWGLPGAMKIAGFLNLGVAVASAWFAWMMRVDKVSGPTTQNHANVDKSAHSGQRKNSILSLVLGATALSSAASFVYEIVWVRMLGMVWETRCMHSN